MSETAGRTFYFEKTLWAKLDEDAKRCLRSSTKQLEAILKAYFEENVDLDKGGLEMIGKLAPRSAKTLPLIEATGGEGEKKKRA